jgi:hypothetical protein
MGTQGVPMLLVAGPLLVVGFIVWPGLYRLFSGTFLPWPLDIHRKLLAGIGVVLFVGWGSRRRRTDERARILR